MGNQVSGLNPNPLVSIEEYLLDLANIVRLEEELCGSRLFKIAKVRRVDDGSQQKLIVKVFPNSSGPKLIWHCQRLMQPYCYHLASGANLLSLTVCSPNVKTLMLVRDFVDQTLADRLCTRPFLCLEEKRWIAFQLLRAAEQLHRNIRATLRDGQPEVLCHGDIKAENVLLTSWGWLLLADPAPFKPVCLPVDNPSEFTHFFDSSRRRVCYLAPERLVKLDGRHEEETVGGIRMGNSPIEASPQLTTDGSAPIVDSSSPDRVRTPPRLQRHVELRQGDNFEKVASEPNLQSRLAIPVPASTSSASADFATNDPLLKLEQTGGGGDLVLTPAMDMFSIGCVLLELFTDGSVAFTLADLLSYKQGNRERLDTLLGRVPCNHAQELISSLLSINPDDRKTAHYHLKLQRGKCFPDVFYTLLSDYMQGFLRTSVKNSSYRMGVLRWTLPTVLDNVKVNHPHELACCAVILSNLVTSTLNPGTNVNQHPVTAAASPAAPNSPSQQQQSINSNLTRVFDRFTKPHGSATVDQQTPVISSASESTKVDVCLALLQLVDLLPSDIILDRILPHLLEMTRHGLPAPSSTGTSVNHHSNEVASLALDAIGQILRLVVTRLSDEQQQPSSLVDVNFLFEYLLPGLASLSSAAGGASTMRGRRFDVQLALARCLPSIAESAFNYLRLAAPNLPPESGGHSVDPSTSKPERITSYSAGADPFNRALCLLRLHIQEHLVNLLSSPSRQVKLTLMNTRGIAKLAPLLGRLRTSDALLSHIISFLNDKREPSLRAAFYDQIGPLTGLLGAQCIGIIRPLLEQGLIDPDEQVIESCLRALTYLLRCRLLSPPLVVAFLHLILALTSHPSRRIRQHAVAYVATYARAATTSSSSDSRSGGKPGGNGFIYPWGISSVYARLSKKEYFVRPIINCFTNDAVLLANLHTPIPRRLLTGLIEFFIPPNTSLDISTKADGRQLFDQFIALLLERKTERSVTRDGVQSYYKSDFQDDRMAKAFDKLASRGMTESLELRLANLHALITSIYEWALLASADGVVAVNSQDRRVQPSGPHVKGRLSASARSYSVLHNQITINVDGSVGLPRSAQSLGNLCDSLTPSAVREDPKLLQSLIQNPIVAYERIIRRNLLAGSLPFSFAKSALSQACGRGLTWRPSTSSLFSSSSSSASSYNASRSLDRGRTTVSSTSFNKASASTMPSTISPSSSRQSSLNAQPPRGYTVSSSSAENQQDGDENLAWSDGSRPKGILAAHLHEHEPGQIFLATHHSGRLLASCSQSDGSIKLWNCGLWQVKVDSGLVSADSGGNGESSSNRRLSSKPPPPPSSEMVGAFCLPTHSTWTWRPGQGDEGRRLTCKGLTWTLGGSSLATVVDDNSLECIDVTRAEVSSAFELPDRTNVGRVSCLVTPSCSRFGCDQLQQAATLAAGTDSNLVACATTGRCMFGFDVRCPNTNAGGSCKGSAWTLSQERSFGLIRSLAIHSCHTWLVCGTSRGCLVSWDLRYLRPVAYTQYTSQAKVGIVNLALAQSQPGGNNNSQLVVTATDRHNEVGLWDLEACASASSAAAFSDLSSTPTLLPTSVGGGGAFAQPSMVVGSGRLAASWADPFISPLTYGGGNGKQQPSQLATAVHGLICLPSSYSSERSSTAKNQQRLPRLLAAGSDGSIRLWDFDSPSDSALLSPGLQASQATTSSTGNDSRTAELEIVYNTTYRVSNIDGIKIVYEQSHDAKGGGGYNLEMPRAESSGLLVNQRNPDIGANASATESPPLRLVGSQIRSGQPVCLPPGGSLDLRSPWAGHKSAVCDLSLLHAGQPFFASASMDGVIKIWR